MFVNSSANSKKLLMNFQVKKSSLTSLARFSIMQ